MGGQPAEDTTVGSQQRVDAVVVGAGFAGMYAVKLLRDRGFTVRCFERGSDVGGTWYWNRYPGARCDIESMQYSYKFDSQLQQEWEWTEKFAAQPEILRYASHVADRFDLRRDIQFDTEVSAMSFDESSGQWAVRTAAGDVVVSAQFCICATGCLSQVLEAERYFAGLDSFGGRVYHTGRWPREENAGGALPFAGRRVAVVGTGSSGMQTIVEIAKVAAHLYVFQRTANFVTPPRNAPYDPEEVRQIKAEYSQIREVAAQTPGGFLIPGLPPLKEVPAKLASPAERAAMYEACWAAGGFAILAAFPDLLLDAESNATAADFVRGKIREMVRDPKTAELLCPKGILGCKRLCIVTDYYEAFNRPNVSLVDISGEGEAPSTIKRVTKQGLLTSDGAEYQVDDIVFATGYDAMTGALLHMDIRGRGGLSLKDYWKDGARSFMGLSISGFPNLFLVTGPGSPSVLTNVLSSIELHVEWIADAVSALRSKGLRIMEVSPKAESEWMQHHSEIYSATLRSNPSCRSWYTGDNVPGKPHTLGPYSGGVPLYTQQLRAMTQDGYRGYDLRAAL